MIQPISVLPHLLNWIFFWIEFFWNFFQLNNILNWILCKAILNRILNESFFGKIQTLSWIRLDIAHHYAQITSKKLSLTCSFQWLLWELWLLWRGEFLATSSSPQIVHKFFLHRTRIADFPRRSQRGNRYIQINPKCRQWKVPNKLKSLRTLMYHKLCVYASLQRLSIGEG